MISLARFFAMYSWSCSKSYALRARFIRVFVNAWGVIICLPLVIRVSRGTHVFLAISASGSKGYSKLFSRISGAKSVHRISRNVGRVQVTY